MAFYWSEVTTTPFSNPFESIERDSEKWCAPDDSNNFTAKFVKGPEDLRLLPGDMDLFPQEVGADEDEWIAAPALAFYWRNVADPD